MLGVTRIDRRKSEKIRKNCNYPEPLTYDTKKMTNTVTRFGHVWKMKSSTLPKSFALLNTRYIRSRGHQYKKLVNNIQQNLDKTNMNTYRSDRDWLETERKGEIVHHRHLLTDGRETTKNTPFPVRLAPCGLRGCKNGPAPFPGRMSYKATKPGLVFVLYLSMFFLLCWCLLGPLFMYC